MKLSVGALREAIQNEFTAKVAVDIHAKRTVLSRLRFTHRAALPLAPPSR